MFLQVLEDELISKHMKNIVDVSISHSHFNIYKIFVVFYDKDNVYFRSYSFFKHAVDYSHHSVIHDVIYSVRHLMNGWDLKYTFS